jgi:hypothetical protein
LSRGEEEKVETDRLTGEIRNPDRRRKIIEATDGRQVDLVRSESRGNHACPGKAHEDHEGKPNQATLHIHPSTVAEHFETLEPSKILTPENSGVKEQGVITCSSAAVQFFVIETVPTAEPPPAENEIV